MRDLFVIAKFLVSYPLAFDTSISGGLRQGIAIPFGVEKRE